MIGEIPLERQRIDLVTLPNDRGLLEDFRAAHPRKCYCTDASRRRNRRPSNADARRRGHGRRSHSSAGSGHGDTS